MITFVRETEGLDFVQAVEWLADRYRVELEYEESSPEHEQGRRRRERLLDLLDATARITSATSGRRRRLNRCARYLAGRGLGEETCKRVPARPLPGRRSHAAEARARRATRRRSSPPPGSSTGAGTTTSRVASSSRSPMRAGACSAFGARRLSEQDPITAKYVNSPESELFHKASLVYGLDRARADDREGGSRDRRRGLHGCARAPSGGLHDGRRGDGDGAHRAPAARAAAPHLAGCTCASTRTRRAPKRRSAAWISPIGSSTRCASSRSPRAPIRPRPRTASRARLETAESYPRYRVKLEIDRAPSREAAFQRVQAVVAAFDQNTEWLDGDRVRVGPARSSARSPGGARATGLAGNRRGVAQGGGGGRAARAPRSRGLSRPPGARADARRAERGALRR